MYIKNIRDFYDKIKYISNIHLFTVGLLNVMI